MQRFITQRLSEMKNQEQRALLKEFLSNSFMPLYYGIEDKYTALEQRIRNELPLVYDKYTIYSTVLPRDRVDNQNDYMKAMFVSEAETPSWIARDLINATKDHKLPVVETVFVKADDLFCRKIAEEQRTLDGTLVSNTGQHQVKCRLEPATRYVECIESLYNTFLRNNVPWTTVNGAYLNKFFDVRIIAMDDFPSSAKIHSFDINFSSYDGFVMRGFIPVWNIDTFRVKGEAFPIQVGDSISYEYAFDVSKLGADNGYLVDYDSGLINNARREENTFIVQSSQAQGLVWNLFRLQCKPFYDPNVNAYSFPVLSNKRKDTFSARLTIKYGARVPTSAAMRTLLLSLETSEFLELVCFRFVEDDQGGDTYDMNPFIQDIMRLDNYQKTLELCFKAKDRDLFINRDLLSFLVSEFQAVYPEYRCVGVLV